MDAYYIRSSPKWGIVSSLHFLLEGYGNQNGACILCFSCNFYDDVTSVTSTHLRNTSYFLIYHMWTPCGWGCGLLTLDCMQCSSYLLNKPHCSVKPVGAWKWICHAKSIPIPLRSKFLFSQRKHWRLRAALLSINHTVLTSDQNSFYSRWIYEGLCTLLYAYTHVHVIYETHIPMCTWVYLKQVIYH